jgi:hypothetical protein
MFLLGSSLQTKGEGSLLRAITLALSPLAAHLHLEHPSGSALRQPLFLVIVVALYFLVPVTFTEAKNAAKVKPHHETNHFATRFFNCSSRRLIPLTASVPCSSKGIPSKWSRMCVQTIPLYCALTSGRAINPCRSS